MKRAKARFIFPIMVTTIFVLSRIISNPLSNVFQKKLGAYADPRVIIAVTHLLLTLACLPALIWFTPLRLGIAFWGNMLLCAALAVGGNTLIVAALQSADLSVLGPLNAYKSIVGLLLGALILREFPDALGILGVLLILGGSFFIIDPERSQEGKISFTAFLKNRGVQLRLAALVLSAAEAVFLKKALLLSSPAITFIFWCMLGLPLAMLVAALAFPRNMAVQLAGVRCDPMSTLLLAITTGLMQFSTLYTFRALEVGYSLALFQTSTLLTVLFGYQFFQEQHIVRRLIGAIVMIAGAALIVVFGNNG